MLFIQVQTKFEWAVNLFCSHWLWWVAVMRTGCSPAWIEGELYTKWVLFVPLSSITGLVLAQGCCSLGAQWFLNL